MTIKVCLCRGNDITSSYKGWKIDTFEMDKKETKKEEKEIVLKKNEEEEKENMALNKFAQGIFLLTKTLEKSEIELLQNHIEISNIKIYDRNEKLNIDYVQKVIEWLKETNFNVVHLLTRSMYKQSQRSIVASMQSLQDQCVLVSPCVCTIRPPAPVDFPCQMVIAVGIQVNKDDETTETTKITVHEDDEEHIPLIRMNRDKWQSNPVKWQSCGSTLDFVCHHQYGEIELVNPWEASCFVTAITILILVKAYALGECNSHIELDFFSSSTHYIILQVFIIYIQLMKVHDNSEVYLFRLHHRDS